MNESILKIFSGSQHVVLPVIHVESCDQALRNAELAHTASCAGVFLINHSIHWSELLKIARSVREEFPGLWLGVNCLELEPEEVVERVGPEISGIWADNAKIDERHTEQPAAEKFLQARAQYQWNGLFFGGVAFKYQRPVADLEQAAKIAARFMDVVTTSGPGTGQPAPREKIASMKRGLGDAPLAIASGITPENVDEYLGLATCFLVATGISRSFTELDPDRLKALLAAVGIGKSTA